jgi:anti-sigma regulatory factor (Ser/Thr protein kinase)/ActR/RegA family two-component response regulator
MGRVLLIDGPDPLRQALLEDAARKQYEIVNCDGNATAIRRVRDSMVDVVLTNPDTSVAEDLALVQEFADTRPGVRVIVLSRAVSREELIAALSAHVFACFSVPYDLNDVIDMVGAALDASHWKDGIEVVSALPEWFTMKVACRLLTASRLVRFLSEYRMSLPEDQHEMMMTAFRELLLNAMGHGGGFNPDSVVEVTAARTARAIVYHIRDPGSGFNRKRLDHAAKTSAPADVEASTLKREELGMRPGGFGILIAQQVADELVYNEPGNQVLLIKYL